jgi:hypothetical protein
MLNGCKTMEARRIHLEGNKNNNSILFADDQVHLTNNDALPQNVIKLDEMLQACDKKISSTVAAMEMKTQIRNCLSLL